MSGSFEARYGGRCAACDEGIRVGDLARFEDDQIVHDDCVTAAPRRPDLPPCGTCFMVPALTGTCGCDE